MSSSTHPPVFTRIASTFSVLKHLSLWFAEVWRSQLLMGNWGCTHNYCSYSFLFIHSIYSLQFNPICICLWTVESKWDYFLCSLYFVCEGSLCPCILLFELNYILLSFISLAPWSVFYICIFCVTFYQLYTIFTLSCLQQVSNAYTAPSICSRVQPRPNEIRGAEGAVWVSEWDSCICHPLRGHGQLKDAT